MIVIETLEAHVLQLGAGILGLAALLWVRIQERARRDAAHTVRRPRRRWAHPQAQREMEKRIAAALRHDERLAPSKSPYHWRFRG